MKGLKDVATAKFNYSALDQVDQPTKIRLNSTVVGVRETERDEVQIDYVQQGTASITKLISRPSPSTGSPTDMPIRIWALMIRNGMKGKHLLS